MGYHHGRMWGIVISSVASVTHQSIYHYEAFAVIMETKMLCSVENTGCS